MIRVDIKQKHIDAGVPGDPHCCAAALAIQEATGIEDVFVDGMTVEVGDHEYKTPALLDVFIDRFDSERDVWPISIVLQNGVKIDNYGEAAL